MARILDSRSHALERLPYPYACREVILDGDHENGGHFIVTRRTHSIAKNSGCSGFFCSSGLNNMANSFHKLGCASYSSSFVCTFGYLFGPFVSHRTFCPRHLAQLFPAALFCLL